MTVDAFITAQQEYIAESNFREYLPTLLIQTPRKISAHVLSNAPEGDDLEQAARQWALQLAGKHDYFLAFRIDDTHLKVIARLDGVQSERIVRIAAT